jgi:hypothetical protein
MFALLGLLAPLFKGAFSRAMDSVDKRFESETAREKAKAEVLSSYLEAQKAILTGPGWWFPLFFIIPLGMWFASVCIYSMLFCQLCVLPQTWSIAALPKPLDEWAGVIVASLFGAATLNKIVSNWNGRK